jgi:hypothetical protein
MKTSSARVIFSTSIEPGDYKLIDENGETRICRRTRSVSRNLEIFLKIVHDFNRYFSISRIIPVISTESKKKVVDSGIFNDTKLKPLPVNVSQTRTILARIPFNILFYFPILRSGITF